MCPIISFSNDKSTTDQKKSPLRFIPSSDFIIENKCNIGHYLILQSMPCIISIGDLRHIWQTLWLSSTHLANPLIVFDTFGKPFDCLRHIWQTLWLSWTQRFFSELFGFPIFWHFLRTLVRVFQNSVLRTNLIH